MALRLVVTGFESELRVVLELELRRFLVVVFVGLVLTPQPRLTSNHSPVVLVHLDLPDCFDCRGLGVLAFSLADWAARRWFATGDCFAVAFGFDFVVVAAPGFGVAVMTVFAIVTLMETETEFVMATCGGQFVALGVRRVTALE